MIRNLNTGKLAPLAGRKLAEWKRLGDLALAALIVSPARAREIQEKLYPEKEMMGRPGIIYTGPARNDKQKRSQPDEDRKAPAEVSSEPWRVTHEFPGSEDALADGVPPVRFPNSATVLIKNADYDEDEGALEHEEELAVAV